MPKPNGTSTYPRDSRSPLSALESEAEDAGAYDTLAQLFLGELGRGGAENDGRAAGSHAGVSTPRPSVTAAVGASALSRESSTPSAAAAGAGPEPVECLILGHLPVLGSAWVSQYARCIAEEEDVTVALVQIRAGYATVELVVADDDLIPAPQSRPTLEAAIGAAAAVAGRWILRVEEPDEPAVASHPGVSTLTLLTSADEMAVVAAYRTLKRLLVDASDADADREEDSGGPEVRVSIMGAPEAAAAAVFAKLSEAARMFIHRPIERAPGVHRVSSTGAAVVLFSGPVDRGAQRAVDAIGAAQRAARGHRGNHRDPKRWIRLGPETSFEEIAPDRDPHDRPAAAASTHDGPAATADRIASAATTVPLASHLPGLTPLAIACPYAPGVELATDGDGRLHVLARHDGAGRPGLEGLTVAAAWAVAHSAILSAAAAGLRPGGGSLALPPVLHMFVDEPRDVRRLLDAEIRVHLLAAVEVAGRTGWLCRDLN